MSESGGISVKRLTAGGQTVATDCDSPGLADTGEM
jgi:hypothetical protein